MNLYAAKKQETTLPKKVPYLIYLESLSSEQGHPISPEFKEVSTITHKKKSLYVLSHNGSLYLSDEAMPKAGLANILFTSKSMRRTLGYGQQLIKSL